MQSCTFLLVAVLCLAASGMNAASKDATNETHRFEGTIQATNPAAGTFTIKSGKRVYLFHISKETKIYRNGRKVSLAAATVGEEVQVAMRVGPRQEGMAFAVVLSPDPRARALDSLLTGKTPHGETVSGPQVEKLITYMFSDDAFSTSINYRAGLGVFLVSVRPDGTVSNVEVLHSCGYGELDERAKRRLMKWKFKPNSLVQVRVPISFSQYR